MANELETQHGYIDKYGKEKLINAAKLCTENRLFSEIPQGISLSFPNFPNPRSDRSVNRQYRLTSLNIT